MCMGRNARLKPVKVVQKFTAEPLIQQASRSFSETRSNRAEHGEDIDADQHVVQVATTK